MYGFTHSGVCTKTRQTVLRHLCNTGKTRHACVFADNVQFEHAFRFVTKAYDVFLATTRNFSGRAIAAMRAHYRKYEVRAIMTTACDHARRTELHLQACAPSPSAKS